MPLGPFNAKTFATTISPWIVTLDALEPFRVAQPVQEPEPLAYLRHDGDHAFDIALEVKLRPHAAKQATTIARTNFRHMYWTMAQQLAHHTVSGCNTRVGDLMGSGTISGPTEDSYGSLLGLTWNGKKPLELKDGGTRAFIEDGDECDARQRMVSGRWVSRGLWGLRQGDCGGAGVNLRRRPAMQPRKAARLAPR